MPRYFFDIADHGMETDDLGEELSGPEDARAHAIVYAGSLLRDDPGLVWDGTELAINVRDEADAPIVSVYVRAEYPAAD